MTTQIATFQELKIWQRGRELVREIYRVTSDFPTEERYGLCSQLRRSAVSIPSNIAEGYARQHSKEFQQYLFIAIGSCAELETQIIIANDLGFCSNELMHSIQEQCITLTKMTQALINKL
jgi:four helix bundle protein